MTFLRELLTFKRVLAFIIIAVVLIFYSKQTATALLPFILAVTFAIILEPMISFLEKRVRIPRGMAVLATLISFGALAFYGIFMVVGQIISELTDLVSLLPQYRETITNLTTDVLGQIEILNESLPTALSHNIQASVQEFLVTLESFTKDFVNRVLAMFSSLPSFLLVSIITLVATFFIARDKNLILSTIMSLVPPRLRQQVGQFRASLSVDLLGFIKGRLFLLLWATLIAGVGLFLIGSRYWILLAIIIGILDNIPVIGPGIIFTPWVAVNVIAGDINRAVYLTILYLVIFSFQQLVEPKILGDSVGLHPLIMLVSIYGGVVFFGVAGIIIGPIIPILIRATTASGLFKWPPYSEE